MKIVEFDALTNTSVERDATAAEQENAAAASAEMEQNAAEFHQKNIAKVAAAAKLGLTTDEIAALFGS